MVSVLEPGPSGLGSTPWQKDSDAETWQGRLDRPGLVRGHGSRSQGSWEREHVGDSVGFSLGLPLWPLAVFLRPNGSPGPLASPGPWRAFLPRRSWGRASGAGGSSWLSR